MSQPTEIVETRIAYQGYVTVTLATLRAPDGSAHTREIEHHGNAACVLPYDPERRVALLVTMPRAPLLFCGERDAMLEAPAGMIDAGESAEAAIIREAMEEAGLALKAVDPVATVWSSPGVSSERSSLFLAAYSKADRTAAGGGLSGEHEAITVQERPLAELAALADAGALTDLKTLALVLALRLRRPELFAGT
jgi:nudix-type nucleoside diphosphatase (YffH/AdpP family)